MLSFHSSLRQVVYRNFIKQIHSEFTTCVKTLQNKLQKSKVYIFWLKIHFWIKTAPGWLIQQLRDWWWSKFYSSNSKLLIELQEVRNSLALKKQFEKNQKQSWNWFLIKFTRNALLEAIKALNSFSLIAKNK